MRKGSLVCLSSAALLLGVGLGSAVAEDLRAVQVFVSLAQRTAPGARAEYLKANAGRQVGGAGSVEAVLPRAYYDTSVPDANPAVALIQIAPGRKVACGLPRVMGEKELGTFPEGTPVTFRGKLADAHDWGEWSTLYLGDCALHPR